MLATKPMPQASRSLRGSYRPCFSGALNTSDPHSLFVGRDRFFMRKRQGDFVESGEQAIATERVHRKGEMIAFSDGYGHRFEINGDAVSLGRLKQRFDARAIKFDRGDAVLEGVAGENVGEARGDHRAHAEVDQRPGG